ncbi:MAG: hypothetical protein HFJ28_05760 [Clostridia bacterium]|nr:hypothetical protein [Clostridia bacterium]
MSYAIIRNENYKMGQLSYIYRHNERKNTNYSNKDIDKNSSIKNYSLKSVNTSYQKAFTIIKEKYNLKGQIKKVSNVMCELIITSDKEFFTRIGEAETLRYFQTAYNFVAQYNNLGEEFIVSAKIHMDESTPHMHIVFIPVIHTKDKKGNLINKIACSEFWKGKESYKILQDKFYKNVTDNGFTLERGNTKENEHINIKQLKKITNYGMQTMFENTQNCEQEKVTNDIEVVREDYRRVINKYNILTKKYSRIKNIIEETTNKIEQIQEENRELKQENIKLRNENSRIREYIDKTLEYVSLLFDFPKNKLKHLISSFINKFNHEK